MHYCDLTRLEKQVFDLLTDDYTVQQIAHTLNISIADVKRAIGSLKQKLGTQ